MTQFSRNLPLAPSYVESKWVSGILKPVNYSECSAEYQEYLQQLFNHNLVTVQPPEPVYSSQGGWCFLDPAYIEHGPFESYDYACEVAAFFGA